MRRLTSLTLLGRLVPAVVALMLLASAMTPIARAQNAQVFSRRLGVSWRSGIPHLSFSARDIANPALVKKLLSGLPQTLLMRVYAYPVSSREPAAVTAVSCRVAYDLWEEVFRVQLQTDQTDRAVIARSLSEVHELCLVMRQHGVGRAEDYARLSGRSIYFAVSVEQNPISRGTIERIRRWLSRPSSNSMGGDAFFGSFVSLFVNRQIGAAERLLQFRSPAHVVP